MKQEIEERERVENTLKESEAMMRIILDSSPDAITVTDTEANIIDCNQTNLDMLDYASKKEIIGRSAFDLISKKQHARAKTNLKRTLERGAVKNIEYIIVKKDGKEFPGEISASIVHDAEGKLAGFVAITKDITVRKEAENALRQSEKELRAQKVALEQKNIATNVNLVLSPILERLRRNSSYANHVAYLDHHMKNLTSSYGRKITEKSLNLSPREVEISDMIKAGLKSKDISRLLNISRQTVEKHRKNIRRKLGIVNKPINLTSYLREL